MSIWTQVRGQLNIKRIKPEYNEKTLDELIGMSWTYEQIYSTWLDEDAYDEELKYQLEHYPEKFMPAGSEGSIQKESFIDPNTGYIRVEFSGSLRDFDEGDWTNVELWFRKTANRFVLNGSSFLELTLDNWGIGSIIKEIRVGE